MAVNFFLSEEDIRKVNACELRFVILLVLGIHFKGKI